jgi:hypothetical protein
MKYHAEQSMFNGLSATKATKSTCAIAGVFLQVGAQLAAMQT